MRLFILLLLVVYAMGNERNLATMDPWPIWPDGSPEVGEISGTSLLLPYIIKTKVPTPAIIICPGGSYRIKSMNNEGYEIAEWLNTIGIHALILDYRLPTYKSIANKTIPLMDAQEAIRVVRRSNEYYNIDKNKIGIMGFSAGGHLAAYLVSHYSDQLYSPSKILPAASARPDFSILIYPVISMVNSVTHEQSRQKLLGLDPVKKDIEYASNENWITADTPPTFLAHSKDDRVVSVENSEIYLGALKEKHVLSELHVYNEGGHGYGLGKKKKGDNSQWPDQLQKWLSASKIIKIQQPLAADV